MVTGSSPLDVCTFGETMALLVSQEVGPLDFANQFSLRVAGAESNVALGLARLGHRVSWRSAVGSDAFGRRILRTLRGEGIDVSGVRVAENAATGVLFKEQVAVGDPTVLYYRRLSAASTLCPEDVPDEWIESARFLHVTGITPALSASCKDAVFRAARCAREMGVTVVLDPNVRRKLWTEQEARETILALCELADVVLPGLDEGTLLTGETAPESVARSLLSLGPSFVAVKLGAEGALAATTDEMERVSGYAVPQVVDTVGAGDAFAAGVLSGLLDGLPFSDAVRRGNAMGAMAITVPGDSEGLPDRVTLDRFLSGQANVTR